MFYSEIDRIVDRLSNHPLWEQATSTTYVPSKFAVQFKDDTAIMSLNVLGHEPKNVEINCFEQKVTINE